MSNPEILDVWVEKIFDTTSIEKKLEVSEKLPQGFLNLTKPEHSCICTAALAFLFELFLTPPPSKKTWRWCQILKLVYFFGGGGIILSEAEAYVEIVYIDQWMLEYIPPVHFIYTASK